MPSDAGVTAPCSVGRSAVNQCERFKNVLHVSDNYEEFNLNVELSKSPTDNKDNNRADDVFAGRSRKPNRHKGLRVRDREPSKIRVDKIMRAMKRRRVRNKNRKIVRGSTPRSSKLHDLVTRYNLNHAQRK